VTGTTENERNALLLLAVLSAAGDSGVPRETLLLYFWPELPWREADASLEGLVREIRRWTHESVILGTDPLRVDPEVVGSDVGDLELAATQGRAEDVVALGHGFFLAGLGENVSPELDAWVKAQRRRLDDLWEHATERARAVDERIPEAAALGPGKGRGWTWPWAYGFAGVALAVVTLFVARAQLDVCAESAFLPTDDLARESTSNAAARDLYDQGMNPLRFRTDSVGRVSLNYFLRAVELDPDYLGAYIELASMYTRLAAPPGEGRVERLARGEQHARKALALNGCVAGAHLALGWVLLSSYRFAEAEESLLRTLELDPSANGARQLLGQLLIFRGRFEEQLALALQAREHDPVAPTPVNEVARGHMLNGRCGDALRWLDIIRDVHPPLLFTVYIRAECLRQQGRWEEAIDLVRGAVPAGESAMLSGLGFTLAQASQTASMVGPDSSQVRLAWAEEALVIRDMLLQRVSRGMAAAEEVALVYVGLGELDLAFEWLEKAIEERTLRFNVMEPPYRALHGDPRFDSLLASLGLPPRLR
jgi:tetratricopeptide (TPR) repeat protein